MKRTLMSFGAAAVALVLAGAAPASAQVLAVTDSSVTEGNAGTITAPFTVTLTPAAGVAATVRFATSDGTATPSSTTLTNPGSITLSPTGTVMGVPYPSTITVPGPIGNVTKVSVTLLDVNHTWPGDLDILLVGPTGAKSMVMSDAGAGIDAVNSTLTFDDGSAVAVPATGGGAVTGTYRPINASVTGDVFPAPAPAGPHNINPILTTVFAGLDPVGTWSLYITDDANQDGGTITGGWSITFYTDQGDYNATAGILSFAIGETSKVVNVGVNGDGVFEGNETYTVTLSTPTGTGRSRSATEPSAKVMRDA
jgi:subtilisin-like proprotein convertase family protein